MSLKPSVASNIITQLPRFVVEEYPLFQKFLETYFEFMDSIVVYLTVIEGENTDFKIGETVLGLTSGATATVKGYNTYTSVYKIFTTNNPNSLKFIEGEIIQGQSYSSKATILDVKRNAINAINEFIELITPDETSNELFEEYRYEFLNGIRQNLAVDPKLLLKNIKQFNRSKGTENSVRTLFKILYGQENIDIYYPKTDILKLSDGDWQQDVVLQLEFDSSYFDFNGRTIRGTVSDSDAFVSNITSRRIGNIPIMELVLTSISGTFTIGENIYTTYSGTSNLVATITGMINGYNIVSAGNGYELGDNAIIVNDPNDVGFGAKIVVDGTSNNQITKIIIENSGSGYQLGDPVIFNNTGTGATSTAEAQVSTLLNPEILEIITTRIFEVVDTTSFNLTTHFNIDIVPGYKVANNETYSNATKTGEIISHVNNELKIYPSSSVPFIDGDELFLFDQSGISVLGSTTTFINDQSFVENASITLDSADYNGALTNMVSTYVSTGTDIVITTIGNHNLTTNNAITIEYATGILQGTTATYNVESITPITDPTDETRISEVFTVTSITSQNGSGDASFVPNLDSVLKNALTYKTEEFGEISTIDINSYGDKYTSFPTMTIQNDYYKDLAMVDPIFGGYVGTNAELSIPYFGGQITKLNIVDSGYGYNLTPTLDLTSSGDATAYVEPQITVLKQKSGKFVGDTGFLSSTKKIQDNDYYQDFSYVLKTTESIDVWKQDVLDMVHPAGFKLFGEVLISTILNARMFDEGAKNINSIDSNGIALYRSIEFLLQSLIVLNPIQIMSDVSIFIDRVLTMNNINEELLVSLLNALNTTSNTPTKVFSLYSNKDVLSLNTGTETTIQTNTPHYFHENDFVYLDEFIGTNVAQINGKLFSIVNVLTDTFTLKQTNGNSVDTTDVIITTQGKTIRTTKELSTGLSIDLLKNEYIGEHENYTIIDFFNDNMTDITTLNSNDDIIMNTVYESVDSDLLLENGIDAFLLDDGVPVSSSTYVSSSSYLGNLKEDAGFTTVVLDAELRKKVLSTSDNIITTEQPFWYKLDHIPQNGFLYYNREIDIEQFVA